MSIQLETFGLASAHLPAEAEYALCRVVQEAEHNIGKYAQATAITLQLVCQPGEPTLVVDDNGPGFDPAQSGAYLGGELLVDSRPGRGTTLTAVVPRPRG